MEAGIFLKKPVFYRHLLLGQKTPPDGNSNIRLAVSNKMNRTNKELQSGKTHLKYILQYSSDRFTKYSCFSGSPIMSWPLFSKLTNS